MLIHWTKFLYFINVFDIICRFINQWFILDDSPLVSSIIEVHRFIFFCLINFMNSMTLMYLFYRQGYHSKIKSMTFSFAKNDNLSRPNYDTQQILEIFHNFRASSLNRHSSERGTVVKRFNDLMTYEETQKESLAKFLQKPGESLYSKNDEIKSSFSRGQFQDFLLDHLALIKHQQEIIKRSFDDNDETFDFDQN
ncbi:UNKNOWN [Stylonychia lemnae]|uniref:Uncharacterized protein n=1 Tax=Stylonychia lemnae TaxID=5949 RepID=A0A077ZR55_STYLE|nr:UNKNOWN [Stylonychia lemnae]|eukprot:CDW71820.1 UNKNOWN [Stylonychia lemnae]